MFDQLSNQFVSLFRNISGRGRITESNVREALEQVRRALLDADVNQAVVDSFIASVLDKAIGQKVLASINPDQQLVAIVHQQLAELMGPVDHEIFSFTTGPTIIMMCGLQGAGKTTTCGKLALYLKGKGRQPLLVAADTQRPAAMDQLETLAQQVEVPVYRDDPSVGPVTICRRSIEKARELGCDVVILDTAGRLHIDAPLMQELRQVQQVVKPHHIFLVVDAMVGQDAVNAAKAFNRELEIGGIILTKFDSDTRGGAALSVKAVTGKPIRFVGVGEKLTMLEEFHPTRMADRILGMGDVVSLVEKAQKEFDEASAQRMQEKIAKATFTLEDFLDQMQSLRKMGPLKHILGMLPGVSSQLKDVQISDKELDRAEAIIRSMTPYERGAPEEINGSRRRRIARGSGVAPEEVSKLVKGFESARNVARKLSQLSPSSRMKAIEDPSIYTSFAGTAGGTHQTPSRLTPEQKRRMRDKRRRGK